MVCSCMLHVSTYILLWMQVKSSKGAACSMDALELSQMDSGDEESDVDGAVCEWSDEDERMVAPCTGLVKVQDI